MNLLYMLSKSTYFFVNVLLEFLDSLESGESGLSLEPLLDRYLSKPINFLDLRA